MNSIIDNEAGTISINTLSNDDIINAEESGEKLLISGTTTGIEEGQNVTITLNGNEYTSSVEADGTWSYEVPVGHMNKLDDATAYQVEANVSDAAGNESVPATSTINVDQLLEATLAIKDGAVSDGTIDSDEVSSVEIGGTIEDGGSIESIVVSDENGNSMTIDTATVTINDDNTWSTTQDLSSLDDGELSVITEIADEAGNSDTFTETVDKDTQTFNTAQLTDSFVDGVSYTTSSGIKGLTGADGTQGSFNYNDGDTITFSIGGVTLGSVGTDNFEDANVFLQNIVGVGLDDANNEVVENLAMLLQKLDSDGDASNGITITEDVRNDLADTTINMMESREADVGDILGAVGIDFSAEDVASFQAQSMEHVQDTISLVGGEDRSVVIELLKTEVSDAETKLQEAKDAEQIAKDSGTDEEKQAAKEAKEVAEDDLKVAEDNLEASQKAAKDANEVSEKAEKTVEDRLEDQEKATEDLQKAQDTLDNAEPKDVAKAQKELDKKIVELEEATDAYEDALAVAATAKEFAQKDPNFEIDSLLDTHTADTSNAQGVDLGSMNEGESITLTTEQLVANSTAVHAHEGDLEVKNVSVDSAIGSIEDNGDGTFTFTPAEGVNGEDIVIDYTVVDYHVETDVSATLDIAEIPDLNEGPVAVDDATSGIVVNETGTDGALVVDSTGSNPELLGGATSVDVTMSLSGEAGQGQTSLFSYASTESHNDFLIFSDGNNVKLYLDGGNVTTGITANELLDGTEHQISVSWDSATGEANFYLDGNLEGTQTIGQGHTLGSNGVLMLGQEQDSVGSSLDAGQTFSGEYQDVSVSVNGTEVAHWDMNGISDSGTVSDSVGNFDLTVVGDVAISDKTLTTDEDSSVTIDVLANDTDADGDTLSITEIQGQDVSSGQTVDVTSTDGNDTVLGTAAVEDGKVVFTPSETLQEMNDGENQNVSFEYTVSDGELTDTGSVTVNVTGSTDNYTPEASDDGSTSVIVNETGTDGALVVDSTGSNPELLGGATSVDVTMSLSGEAGQGQTSLFSYASTESHNDFLIFSDGNNVKLYLDGGNVTTGITANELLDGTEHQISVSWDSATGEANFYLDGNLEGTQTIGQGHTLGSNGVLMLGQEQDSVGSSLDAGQTFSGEYQDVSVSVNGTEVAHWDMNGISDSGTVSDSVGNFDLTVVGDVAISDKTLTTDEDSSVTIDVLANDTDADGDTLSITEIQGQDVSSGQTVDVTSTDGNDTVLGTAAVEDGKVVFTPSETLQEMNDGENQNVSFEYTVSDGELTDTGSVTVNVTGSDSADIIAPDAPVITNIIDTTDDSSAATVTISGTAEAGSTLELFDGDASLGTVEVGDNGFWSISPSEFSEGTHEITAQSTDTAGNTSDSSSVSTVGIGTDGVDRLKVGGDGVDYIAGEEGNDKVYTSEGADVLDGGEGEDYVTYYDSDEGVNVNLGTNEVSGGNAEGDTISNFENVAGSAKDDTLTGSDEDNIIYAGAGDDVVDGGAGDDQISGAEGNDRISGGEGTDKVVLKGEPEDYLFTQNNDGTVTVEDLRTGSENQSGTDTLDGVENVRFDFVDDSGVNHYDTESLSDMVARDTVEDTTAPDITELAITNIVDNDGDYSSVTMSGTGAEIGNTVTIYDESSNAVATATVQDDGSWSADISDLAATGINDNEFFKVTETDSAGNTTAQTDATQYWHGKYSNASTEASDDYAIFGDGDDKLRLNDDDTNDSVVFDGGNGNDTAVFSGNQDDYTITTNVEGHTIVTENISTDSDGDGVGDVNELRNVETITFADGTVSVNDLQNDNSGDLLNATLIDGVMIGVEYTTDSGVHGLTDAEGSYSFRDGDTITFNVGGVTLGSVTSDEALNGQTFLQDIADVDRTNLNDEYLENMATLLQSLDTDASDNITITQETRDALADASIDLRTASEEDVQALVESVGATYVDEADAMEHVQDMLEEYAGIDESEFEEHIDDDLLSATLVTGGVEGITYTTSSGEEGTTGADGAFHYAEGDTITFLDATGNVIATVESADIGGDNSITYEELLSANETTADEVDTPELIEEVAEVEEVVEVAQESEEPAEVEEVVEVVQESEEPVEVEEVVEVAQESEEPAEVEEVVEAAQAPEEDTAEEFELLLAEDDFNIDLSAVESDTLSSESTEEIDDSSVELDDVLDTETDNVMPLEVEETAAEPEAEQEWTLGNFATEAETTSEEPQDMVEDNVDVGLDTGSEIVVDQS